MRMLSICDNGAIAPCPAPFNLAAYVLGRADMHPDKPALEILSPDALEVWTYGQLKSAVLGTATGLLGKGLQPGDILLMRLGNTVDFPIAYLGALAAGIVPVPTSAALTEAEVAFIIETVRPRAILRDPEVACPDHRAIVPLEDLRAMRELPASPFQTGDPNRLGYIVFTSGTSGKPRAVAHAHRSIWARQMMFDGWYGLRREDRLMHAGAFNWTYTLGTGLMDPWTIGATALIPAAGTPASNLTNLLVTHEATIFAAAPGVYRQMLKDHVKINQERLRHGLSAGEKLPEATRAAWEAATDTPIYEAYGMSECSTFLSACPDHPAKPGSLGRPQPGRRVAIIGSDGPVPRGTEGTIAVHRSDPGLMLRYLDAPEETAARFQGDWFVTGDQGVMDAQGDIHYLGRADDMMNAGGYRVSPIEIEQALITAPGITGIGAAEVEVKKDVRVIAAFYTATHPLDDAALAAYAETRLARYKQPRLYVHVPRLPLNANGKLLRRALPPYYEEPPR